MKKVSRRKNIKVCRQCQFFKEGPWSEIDKKKFRNLVERGKFVGNAIISKKFYHCGKDRKISRGVESVEIYDVTVGTYEFFAVPHDCPFYDRHYIDGNTVDDADCQSQNDSERGKCKNGNMKRAVEICEKCSSFKKDSHGRMRCGMEIEEKQRWSEFPTTVDLSTVFKETFVDRKAYEERSVRWDSCHCQSYYNDLLLRKYKDMKECVVEPAGESIGKLKAKGSEKYDNALKARMNIEICKDCHRFHHKRLRFREPSTEHEPTFVEIDGYGCFWESSTYRPNCESFMKKEYFEKELVPKDCSLAERYGIKVKNKRKKNEKKS